MSPSFMHPACQGLDSNAVFRVELSWIIVSVVCNIFCHLQAYVILFAVTGTLREQWGRSRVTRFHSVSHSSCFIESGIFITTRKFAKKNCSQGLKNVFHFICWINCDRFTSDVKIKSISIVGGAGGTSPSKMRA